MDASTKFTVQLGRFQRIKIKMMQIRGQVESGEDNGHIFNSKCRQRSL